MMKLPWSKSETKSAQSLIALSQLPVAAWEYSNNWGLVDAMAPTMFRIETRLGEEWQLIAEQSSTWLMLEAGSAEQIRVAAIGDDYRLGEWVSIPLPPA